MDVLLLGAAAIVLIVLTVVIVWRAPSETVRSEDTTSMLPQGDTFEDQYTSATADLSAGGVAITNAGANEPEPATQQLPATRVEAPPSVRRATITTEGWTGTSHTLDHEQVDSSRGKTIGVGAAAALTVAGAAVGAWLYSRWRRGRNRRLDWIKLRRRFR